MSSPYDDIIDTPYPRQSTRVRMSRENRAAQFAPFAALTGYGAAVAETARLTEKRLDLSSDYEELLNRKLQLLSECIDDKPVITLVYFSSDPKKDGGHTLSTTAALKKIDEHERSLILDDGTTVLLTDIIDIESSLLSTLLPEF